MFSLCSLSLALLWPLSLYVSRAGARALSLCCFSLCVALPFSFFSSFFLCRTWWHAWHGEINEHRAWAVRFLVYTHSIPALARIIGVFVWLGYGRPQWSPGPRESTKTKKNKSFCAQKPPKHTIFLWLSCIGSSFSRFIVRADGGHTFPRSKLDSKAVEGSHPHLFPIMTWVTLLLLVPMVRQLRHHFDHFPRISQLYATPHTPCNMLYEVPILN